MSRLIKRLLVVLGVMGSATAVAFFFWPLLFSRLLEQSTSDEVLFHVDIAEKVIALTIDDGPHAQLTPQILEVLAEHRVPATFFLIGSQVPGNEALLRRMVREGHELGNHLMTDERSVALEPAELAWQLATTHELLSEFAPVRWFRPGSGFYTKKMLAQIRPYHYRVVIGSIYPYDAHVHSVEFASTYILSNAQPGGIIILHDGGPERDATPEILRRIIPALKQRGYRFVTLTELTNG